MVAWIGAAIGGVASLLGGRSQARAADKQGQLQKQIFDRQRRDLAPWRESGQRANNALAFEMGIGPRPTFGGSTPQIREIAGQPSFQFGQFGGLPDNQLGNLFNGGGQGTRFEVDGRTFNTRQEAQSYADSIATPGEEYGGFQMSPYQQFTMDQGRQQVEASAAARGNRFSGATMNAVNDRGQMMSNAFRGEYLDRIGGMSTTGQNAAAQSGAFAGQYAQGMAGVNSARGNAQAGGMMGFANAINSGINNTWAMNAYNRNMGQNPNNNQGPMNAIPWLGRMTGS